MGSTTIDDNQFFKTAKEDAQSALDELERKAGQVDKILINLQDGAAARGVQNSTEQFGELIQHHKDYECYWLIATGVCVALLLGAVTYAFAYDVDSFATGNHVVNGLGFLKRIFLISVPVIFLRISLDKYNSERELRIVYGHRETVLNQYKNFEAGIGDDQEAKNQFRLEIAKYIFSDPRTGYGNSDSDGGSININPIVSTVEGLVNKK